MLEIRQLTLTTPLQPLFRALDLQIAPGEVVVLMGPSGSGKSSLLNWMVGELPSELSAQGELWLGGQRLDTVPTERRGLGILFQDDALFGHLSVGHNLAFALPARWRGAQRRERVEQALAEAGLGGQHDRDPATLSGGQRARASLMRALLAEPRALLLDEPFARLDTALRAQFRAFVFGHVASRSLPTLLVTHDAQDVPPGARVLHLPEVVGEHRA